MINIQLNGERHEIADHLDLERLLDLFSLPKQRIAVEINNAVVRRIHWPDTSVSDGDKIEVVHFVGGG